MRAMLVLLAALLIVGCSEAHATSYSSIAYPSCTCQTPPCLPFHSGDAVVFAGDSITFGLVSHPWMTTMEAALSARLGTLTNSGHSGYTVANLQTVVMADVIAPAPDVVIIEAGLNDKNTSVGTTTFGNNIDTYTSTISTALPGVRLAWVNIFSNSEQYPDPDNANVVAYNNVIAARASADNYLVIDVRTAQQAYEAAHNFTNASQGLLTVDSQHPNDQAGGPLMSGVALQDCTF